MKDLSKDKNGKLFITKTSNAGQVTFN